VKQWSTFFFFFLFFNCATILPWCRDDTFLPFSSERCCISFPSIPNIAMARQMCSPCVPALRASGGGLAFITRCKSIDCSLLAWGKSVFGESVHVRLVGKAEKDRALVIARGIPVKASKATAVAEPEGFQVTAVPTKPIEGQKTGTSGLRKKVKVFQEPNYLANWIQALFNSLPEEDVKGTSLVLGGDGRYFNKEAAQVCDILPPTIAM
jgi:hypothetical protein